MLDRLEKMGYIKRVPSKADRREIYIQLTDKDRELQEKYILVSQIMNDLFYHGLSEKEIDLFESTLERLYANLQTYDNM